jgi:GT2 family glycosyltransferase
LSITKPDISIIIVSYNVQKYLCNCIDSLLAQTDIVVEIIVVDNNSTDGTIEILESKYPNVKRISNSYNAGFSAANNQGIKESSGETILVLNPDTELMEADTLRRMKDSLNSNPQTAIVAPCLINSDGSFQLSFWNYPGIKELLFELFYIHKIKKTEQPASAIEVEAASGAALIFRKSLINEIGGLDENMFWMEDVDFCYRAFETGKKIILNPEIKIIHHGGKSSVGNYDITIPNQVMSRIKFSKKHDTKPEFYLINMLSLIFICSRLSSFTLGSVLMKKSNAKRKAYVIALKSYFSFNFQGSSAIIK